MNGTTARRLRHIARSINPGGTGTLKKTRTSWWGGGSISVRRTGTRASYQNLKRQLNETPRPMRGDLLAALESYQR